MKKYTPWKPKNKELARQLKRAITEKEYYEEKANAARAKYCEATAKEGVLDRTGYHSTTRDKNVIHERSVAYLEKLKSLIEISADPNTVRDYLEFVIGRHCELNSGFGITYVVTTENAYRRAGEWIALLESYLANIPE